MPTALLTQKFGHTRRGCDSLGLLDPTSPSSAASCTWWAVMDWATRRVFSWRLSNTLDARFCTEALTEALKHYGRPEILNTDQPAVHQPGVHLRAQRRWRHHFHGRQGPVPGQHLHERLWRSLKYEAVYLHELSDGFQAQRLVARWFNFYDRGRPHSALGAPPQPRPTKTEC